MYRELKREEDQQVYNNFHIPLRMVYFYIYTLCAFCTKLLHSVSLSMTQFKFNFLFSIGKLVKMEIDVAATSTRLGFEYIKYGKTYRTANTFYAMLPLSLPRFSSGVSSPLDVMEM